MCAKVKENWLEKQCTVIKQDKSCVRSIYKKVQELTGDINKSKSAGIKLQYGKLLTE